MNRKDFLKGMAAMVAGLAAPSVAESRAFDRVLQDAGRQRRRRLLEDRARAVRARARVDVSQLRRTRLLPAARVEQLLGVVQERGAGTERRVRRQGVDKREGPAGASAGPDVHQGQPRPHRLRHRGRQHDRQRPAAPERRRGRHVHARARGGEHRPAEPDEARRHRRQAVRAGRRTSAGERGPDSQPHDAADAPDSGQPRHVHDGPGVPGEGDRRSRPREEGLVRARRRPGTGVHARRSTSPRPGPISIRAARTSG